MESADAHGRGVLNAPLDVRMLGPLEVTLDGVPMEIGGPQQKAVIAWLALADGRVVPAERLIDRLWGDDAPASATGTLQSYISRLRRALEPDRAAGEPARIVVSEAPGYALRLPRANVDVFRFEDAAERGRDALADGNVTDAIVALEDALGTWRGDALAGLGGDVEWEPVVVRLQEERAVVTEDRFDALLAAGRHAAIVGELREAVAEQPLRERRWAQLALALYRSHRQSDALRTLTNARATLVEHVGVDPGPELQLLESRILAQDPALGWSLPTEGTQRADRPDRGDGTAPGRDATAQHPGPATGPARPDDGTTPVGRTTEWARLTAAIATAALGQPIVVVVDGDAGIGKTTMLDSLADTANAAGWRVGWGRCVDEGLAPALWPWIEVIRSLGVEDAAAVRPALGQFASADVDPGARVRSLVELADDIVTVLETAAVPLLVVIDDLHWADAASLDVLGLVAQRITSGRVVLALAHRRLEPGSSPRLADALATVARMPVVERITLDGLARDAVAALIAQVAGAPADDADVDAVLERTAGNPLFVAELARLPHRLRVAGAPVPEAVRDVVRTRLRHLTHATMELLLLAGLLGHEVDLKVLAEASGRDLDACLDDLDPAVVMRVLVQGEQGRFSFGHALVRDALMVDLSPLRRARMHLRAAIALETLYGADRDHAEPIAMHRWASLSVGDPLVAAEALVVAAEVARFRGALVRAAELTDLALTAAAAGPMGTRRLDVEVTALETMLRVETLRSFMGERLDEIADRIDEVADQHDSDVARMLALFTRWSNVNRGHYLAMDEHAAAALALADRSSVPYVRLMGRHVWGSHCWHRGHITDGAAVFRLVLDEEDELLASGSTERIPPLNFGGNACAVFATAGDEAATERALMSSDRLIATRVRTAPTTKVDTVFTHTLVATIRGDAARATEASAGLVAGELGVEHPHFSPACRLMHGWGRVMSVADATGLDLLAAGIAEISATPVSVGLSMFRSLHAEALLQLGRAGDAVAILRDVAQTSEASGDGWWLAETLRLLALAELATGAPMATAGALLERALTMATEQGAGQLVMRCRATSLA